MDRFMHALAGLASILGEPMPKERLLGYVSVLDHYDEDQLVAACRALAGSTKFFPKPVEFVDLIETGELPGENQETVAAEAWGRIQSSITSCEAVSMLCQSDGRINAGVMALNGWYAMLHGDEDPHWQRKTFIAAFCGYKASQRRLLLEGKTRKEIE